MLAVLEALATSAPQWRHGYDLIKSTGLQSGTIYPLLMRMSDHGLVEAKWLPPAQPGRPARHAYRLTPDGAAVARAAADQPVAGRRLLPT